MPKAFATGLHSTIPSTTIPIAMPTLPLAASVEHPAPVEANMTPINDCWPSRCHATGTNH
jgi:hypothetical protein